MRRLSAHLFSCLAAIGAGMMLAGVTFLLISNWWVHRQGARLRTYDALADVPGRDFAIVPGTGGLNGNVGDRFRNRLLAGLSLYRAHKVKRILVSGVGIRPGGADEVSSGRVWLLAHGVNPRDVIIDRFGFRTLDTMQRAVKVFGITSAVVCTQVQHADRSVFLAHAAGIDVVGFKADMRDTLTNYEVRLETLKATLAFVDTYVLHRGPRETGLGPVTPAGVVASEP
jgi:SanA protein